MKRILLVAGNVNISRFIRRELSASGYQVMEVADGQEALLRLKEDNPDILIVDIHTKKKKALELFRSAAVPAGKPLIILTSKTPFETDVSTWKTPFVLERSGNAPELLAALGRIEQPPPAPPPPAEPPPAAEPVLVGAASQQNGAKNA